MVDSLLEQLESILGSRLAALKMLINNQGFHVDGRELEARVPDFPAKYKTKRSRTKAAVVNGAFVDTETADHPFIPSEILIRIGDASSVVKTNYRPESPLRLTWRDGELSLSATNSDLEVKAELLALPAVAREKIGEFPAKDYVQVIGADRLGILSYTGCANWFYGNQCKFCDSCASRPGEQDAKPSLNDLHVKHDDDPEAWWAQVGPRYQEGLQQAYRLTMGDPTICPHRHVHLMAGNLMQVDTEWRIALGIAESLAQVSPLDECDAYINLLPPPDPAWLSQAKELGFKKVIFNLEVFGDKSFRIVCPGKNSLVPYPQYLERMEQAAKVFGHGKVYCGFVFGAQKAELTMEGVNYLAARGIVADYTSFTPKPGTPWAKRHRPELMATAEFVTKLAGVYRAHGFEPMYCSQSLRSSVMNEVILPS